MLDLIAGGLNWAEPSKSPERLENKAAISRALLGREPMAALVSWVTRPLVTGNTLGTFLVGRVGDRQDTPDLADSPVNGAFLGSPGR